MNTLVYRVFVEKKQGFNIESSELLKNINNNLNIKGLKNIKVLNRYDVSNISKDDFKNSIYKVFAEKNQDNVFIENFETEGYIFGVEYLPGQFDQRADSASQCIQIITGKERPTVKYAKIIVLKGNLKEKDINRIKDYYINPVDSREASLLKPLTIEEVYPEPPDVSICSGFILKDKQGLETFIDEEGLAMNIDDLLFCQDYYKNRERRDPTLTEIKVIDTYWSDHCRHTTFLTKLEDISFQEGKINERIKLTYNNYLKSRDYVYENKKRDINLMDIATISMKELRKKGKLEDLEVSDEINACSIEVKVDVDGNEEDWLVMFKNETHNHPTEIEPFGGAATCLGGAIRDPLSGRSYVYQGMRVTGSGDPRQKIENTLEGKLPQIKITQEAARGFSAYGNQIGLATGEVREYYDENFIAKRMEVGAVIAAAPKENVVRGVPEEGDIVLLIGGKTGRDGCGGATGSSKIHTEESIEECGSEVQKGNPPEERKIQRLFRNPNASKLIKKCNDFGAGGVSVAIGELAEGLKINLDAIPKKYEGLNGTELAISESQERMAVIIDKDDLNNFVELAEAENLEVTEVAEVTREKRLIMTWRNNEILNMSRDFLDSSGVKQKARINVLEPEDDNYFEKVEKSIDVIDKIRTYLQNLNISSQKGLREMFDSTIGTTSVLMPYGGKYKLTPVEGMVSKVPLEKGDTKTCTIMTHGYDPKLAKWSPYHGGLYAVVNSIAKIVALGGDYRKIRLSLQEYFEKLGDIPEKWGKPFSALLGALDVQMNLDIPAVGGKDSMSGTFKDLDVPPTLISFAVGIGKVDDIISPELKKIGSKILRIPIVRDANMIPDYEDLKEKYYRIHEYIQSTDIISASAVDYGGAAVAISKMSFGNRIGFKIYDKYLTDKIFNPYYGDIIVEVEKTDNITGLDYEVIGETVKDSSAVLGRDKISLDILIDEWEKPLSSIFRLKKDKEGYIKEFRYDKGKDTIKPVNIMKNVKPKVFIPVFPGTNCEYDTGKAFTKAGGKVNYQVFKNLNQIQVDESIKNMAENIKKANIIAIPGGFSSGDEPDGSGKFITAVFRNPYIKESVSELMDKRDGLIIGICNGFQALIKLGLVQKGRITDIEEDYPTLTFNNIGRHISTIVRTKITSNLSPWYNQCSLGDVYNIPVSHGEGRFVADDKWIERLEKNGQIATQYVDENNKPSYKSIYNPNGSKHSIESITSPDGRILGKMGHSERIGRGLYKNIEGNTDQKIFESGVNYFK